MDRRGGQPSREPVPIRPVEVLSGELGDPDLPEHRFDPLNVCGVPPDRPRFSKRRDEFEPAVEKLANGRGPAQRLDWPAVRITADEHPDPPDARTTLGHGAFHLDLLGLLANPKSSPRLVQATGVAKREPQNSW